MSELELINPNSYPEKQETAFHNKQNTNIDMAELEAAQLWAFVYHDFNVRFLTRQTETTQINLKNKF